MMIGRTRLAVGPVRDLGQLDVTIGRIRTIPGVERVSVEAFVDRRVLLAVHVLHPVDLAGELRLALGGDVASCTVGAERVEVVLRAGRSSPGDEVVDGTLEDDPPVPPWSAERPVPAAGSAATGPWGDAGPAPRAAPRRPAAARPAPVLAAPRPAPRGLLHAGAGSSAGTAVAVRGPAAGVPDGARGSASPIATVSSAELLELSFARAPVAKALISPRGRWLRVNDRLCDLLGRDEGDLLRCSLDELCHPEDVGSDDVLLRALLAGAIERYAAPKRYLRPGGQVLSARLEVAAVRDGDGAVRWLVLELVDLGDRADRRPARALEAHAA